MRLADGWHRGHGRGDVGQAGDPARLQPWVMPAKQHLPGTLANVREPSLLPTPPCSSWLLPTQCGKLSFGKLVLVSDPDQGLASTWK